MVKGLGCGGDGVMVGRVVGGRCERGGEREILEGRGLKVYGGMGCVGGMEKG
ncbi:IMP dehydrogenase, partial [Bacillus altitudinis]|uniref:IMP dehydrogenase n=1 Tax=Bacillus altitudinis TaxID=293387 RepID=UPI003B524AB4